MFDTMSQKSHVIAALIGASLILFPILLVGAGQTRRTRQLRGLGWLVWAGLVVGAAAAWTCPPHWITPSDEQRLKPAGDAIVATLDAYHTRNGRYPDRLETALGTVPHASEYGPWRYVCIDNGDHFSLTAGTLADHGFELTYTDEMEDWAVTH